jgi:hypothetical protein
MPLHIGARRQTRRIGVGVRLDKFDATLWGRRGMDDVDIAVAATIAVKRDAPVEVALRRSPSIPGHRWRDRRKPDQEQPEGQDPTRPGELVHSMLT